MNYFCNMDYDTTSEKWWVDAFDNWPSYSTTRTWYNTKEEAYIYYYSIINNNSQNNESTTYKIFSIYSFRYY